MTQNVLSLATTVRDIDAVLRQRFALDAEDGPEVLDHKPAVEPLPVRQNGRSKVAVE